VSGLFVAALTEMSPKAFDNLRVNLLLRVQDEKKLSIAVVSSEHGAGRTTVAIQIALLFAQLGRRVVLVDADLRNADLHKRLGWENSPGLVDVVVGSITLKGALREHAANSSIDVLTAGAELLDVTGVLSSDKFRRIVADLASDYEVCVFDTPAMTDVQDALLIAQYMTGTVFVVHAQKSHARKLAKCKERLLTVNENILGFVMNGMTES